MKMTKKIMALGLSVVISLFSLPVIYCAAEPSDTATHISSLSDFKAFADNCRRDEWSYGKSFVLDNDIAFGSEMIMVASFAGTFDGNGHIISNVSIEGVASNTGLFGIVYASGTVKNLTVMGTYEPTGVLTRLGGIAGANHGLIENCTFSGSINANSVMGGICGYNWSDGRIVSCTSMGMLTGSDKIGGIAGVNDGTITKCENSAKVNTTYDEQKFSSNQLSNIVESITMSDDYNLLNAIRVRTDVGGIAGVNAGRIEDCLNEENVGYKQVGYNTGGIAGRSMGLVKNSVNRAGIYGRQDTGGIVGQQQPYLFLDYSDSDLTGLGKGLDELNSSVNDALKDVSGLSTRARNELIGIADTVGRAKDQLKVITDTLGDGIDDISGQADSLINDGTDAVKEIDAQIDSIKEDLKKLIERLHEIGEEKDSIFDAIDNLEKALSLKDSDKIESAYEELSKVLSDVEDKALLDTLSDLGDSLNEDSDFFKKLERAGGTLSDINSRISRLNGDLRSAGNDFYSTITLLVSQIKEFSNTVDSGIQSASKKLNNVVSKGNSVVGSIQSSLASITSSFMGSIYQDASGEDIENAVFGRTTGSTNYGSVTGDTNAGGIVGNASIEVDLNPDIDISGAVKDDAASLSDASMKSRCLIDHCINRGEITARQIRGGAIVGSMDTGLVTDCEGYGKLTVAGTYAGGIAGYSKAEIRSSYAKLDMYGKRYVGGIAGYGTVIHDCIAMADIVDAEQFIGAVAGNVAEVDSKSVYNNYYYSQNDHGIDGISYSGIAEGKTFDELLSTGRLPEGFSNMTLTFQADGSVVKTLKVPFGSTVLSSDIPAVPNKDGFRGVWSRSDFTNIVGDEVIKATYTRINTLLQSDLLRKGRPVMVTMGEFTPGDKLSVSEEKTASSFYDYQYHIVIPEDGLSQHQLRYQPENEGVNVYFLKDGDIASLIFMKQAGSFGRYATIDVTGNEMDIAIIEINEGQVNLIVFLLFAIPIAVTVIIIVLVVRHNKKKAKAKAK